MSIFPHSGPAKHWLNLLAGSQQWAPRINLSFVQPSGTATLSPSWKGTFESTNRRFDFFSGWTFFMDSDCFKDNSLRKQWRAI